jgi:hypothetical protein
MTNSSEFVKDFGPYKLVVREVDGKYHGILWRTEANHRAVRLIQVTANSSKEAKTLVDEGIYQLRLDQSGETVAAHTDQAQFVKAWMYIWPNLNPNQKRMIIAQYNAPNRQMTATQLAGAAQWDSYNGANRWYGDVGLMMFIECPTNLPKDERTGKRIFSFSLSNGWKGTEKDNKQWVWEMRPEIAAGLKLSGLI